MDKKQKSPHLEVPEVRKSYAILKEMRELSLNTPMSSPQASSTQERNPYNSLVDPRSLGSFFPSEKSGKETFDSSLGLIDIENCQGLGEDSTVKHSPMLSLPFNPKEMSGRSSTVDDFKENQNPTLPSIDINSVIQKAKRQSIAVDNMLKSSNNPAASKQWESLESYRHSLANPQSNKLPNNPFDSSASVCSLSESMKHAFSGEKPNMSMEELSWVKEKGALPIVMSNTFKISPENEGRNLSYQSGYSYVNDSKMSMGNYFRDGCVDINNIFNTKSPEKKASSALYSSKISSSYNTSNTLMNQTNEKNDTPSSHPQNTPKFDKEKTVLSDTIDDTLSSGTFSLTQIKNIMENLNCERPSVIIDNMLKGHKNTKKNVAKSGDQKISTLSKDISNDSADIFHSTKYSNYHEKQIQDNFMKLSPIHETSKSYRSSNSTQNTLSSSKNTRASTGYTNSIDTTKSGVTVVQGKNPGTLHLIEESNELNDTSKSSIGERLKKEYMGMSPGVKSTYDEKAIQLTPSDVTSKEIKDLMSSSDHDDILQSPISGRHVKRLIDHYQQGKLLDDDIEKVWISPTKAKIYNLSKECNPSVTPLRMENVKMFSDNIKTVDEGDIVDFTHNGDWIKVEPVNETVLVGTSHDLKLKISSVNSGWLSVNFAVNKVSINEEPYLDDIRNVVLLQAPLAKILLKSDSVIECILKLMCLIVESNIRIQLNIILTDFVTQKTSTVLHDVLIESCLPKLSIRNVEGHSIDKLEFPMIPKKNNFCASVVLKNDSHENLSLKICLLENDADCFEIIDIENVLDDDIAQIRSSNVVSVRKPSSEETFTLPYNENAGLLIKILFHAPNLENDMKLKNLNALLNISLMPPSNYYKNPISIQNIPISGGVGISSLLIRTNQKSDVLFLQSGMTENMEILNAGTIEMNYKLYFALHINKDDPELNVTPCDRQFFTLDQSNITLKPNEKALVKISYPLSVGYAEGVKRLLAFESPFSTEVIDVVGVPVPSRCPSQQSVYSVESTSEINAIMIKCSKKELSWGCLKVGETKIQDITFKNVSHNKKLRVLVMLTGEGFKVLSDTGLVSTLSFTLQPQECRALHVEFKPVIDGGHSGMLKILKRSNDENAAKAKTLFKAPLHGFGGQSVLIFRDGVFRHAGAQGLPLGSLHDSGEVKQIHFTVWNRGAAPGFVLFQIELKWKYRSLGDGVFITPSHMVVQPGDATKCTVTIPRKAGSLARGQLGETETVATLIVFHGDETTRLRIKKICQENELADDTWKQLTQGKLDRLCDKFSGEDSNLGNIAKFKESSTALHILLNELQQKEVVITYDLNLDYSIAHLSSDSDETLKFYSIHNVSADLTLM